jgi:hypothetical protein
MVIGLEQLNTALRVTTNTLANDTAKEIKAKVTVSYPELKLAIHRIQTTATTTKLRIGGVSEIDKGKHNGINRKIESVVSDVIKQE